MMMCAVGCVQDTSIIVRSSFVTYVYAHREEISSMTLLTRISLSVLVSVVLVSRVHATEHDGYSVVKTINVPGEGRWDFLTVDPSTHRLYIPRSSHVQVLDTQTGKVVEDWSGTDGVHGVALVPTKHLAFTSNGRSNDVSVVDLQTGKKIASAKAGASPDAIIYDE